MHLSFNKLLSLPPTLLTIIISCASPVGSAEWPYNLPAHVKYYPEEEHVIKRNVEIEQKFSSQTPVGMKKMSGEPGEKFLMDFWYFETDYSNASISLDLEPVLRPHQLFRPRVRMDWLRARSVKRDFQCPAGSFACTSIGRSDACCGTGSTCQIVPDNGLGDVGCCPSNQVCGGSVSSCPADYSSCPQAAPENRGGCCLPGYACFGAGCVATSTAYVVVTPTPSTTSISTSTSPPTSSISSSTIIPPPPVTTSSSTSSTITTPPSTSSPNVLTCSSGFRSCPASLGGGCCPTGRACGSDICPEMSSTGSFTAPARPTSGSTTTSFPNVCPTGFYACSAYYQGGCCQIGRDCAKTSCPSTASITVVNGNSITVAAPTGSGATSVGTILTGQCASGWNTCAQTVGGGCCPSGYACGQACTASLSDGRNSTVGKIAPNDAQRHAGPRLLVFGVASVILVGIL